MPPAEFPGAQAIERLSAVLLPLHGKRAMRLVSAHSNSSAVHNCLLAALLPRFRFIATALRAAGAALKQDVERPNRWIEFVRFVKTGIASVVAVQSETRVEVGLIGREGDERNCRGAGWRPIATFHLRPGRRTGSADHCARP
jgi:hypothetical protein